MSEESNVVDAEVTEATTQQSSSPDNPEGGDWKEKVLSADHWLRFVFMVLFAGIACVASYVVAVLIFIQFVFALFTGNPNDRLRIFGASLSQYIFEILSFLTYNSEDKPFPFADWPEVINNIDQKDID